MSQEEKNQLMLDALEDQFKHYVDTIGLSFSRTQKIREVLTSVKGYDPLKDHVA